MECACAKMTFGLRRLIWSLRLAVVFFGGSGQKQGFSHIMKETSVSAQNEMAETNESGSFDKQRAEENSAETSNQDAAGKPTEEANLRYKRVKLFDKVMQASLNNFIEQAR